nr:MAG TPA: hypothetical protein [Bacteriophage sp.]
MECSNKDIREAIRELGMEKLMDLSIELKSRYVIRGYRGNSCNDEVIDGVVSIHKKLKEIRDASPS